MNRVTNVFIADDHQAIIDGIKAKLVDEEDLIFAGQALDCATLKNRIGDKVDVLLLDVLVEGSDFFLLIQELQERHPHLCTLVLTRNKSLKFAEMTIEHGARGFLEKSLGLKDIFNTIRESMRFPNMTVIKIPDPDPEEGERERFRQLLTPRQLQVIALMCKGCKNNEEIAEFLRKINKRPISAEAVRTHRRDIRRRLRDEFEISNDASLGYWVGKLDILDGSELSSTEDDE